MNIGSSARSEEVLIPNLVLYEWFIELFSSQTQCLDHKTALKVTSKTHYSKQINGIGPNNLTPPP